VSETAPQWAAVIINYNAGALLSACVASVLADDSAGAGEVVVVDNASVDSSIADVRAQFPDVRIIETGANLGYATAANRGIAATTTPIVAVLNPDLVVAPGTAAGMLAAFPPRPELAAAGPKILDPDGEVYPSARRHPGLATAIGHASLARLAPNNRWTRRYRNADADPDKARDVDWISGAALWLRRDALNAVGGWDERYFMYVEDVDLCWRLRKAGYSIGYEPSGCVTHVQGATTSRRPYRMIVEHHRSWYRFTSRRWTGARRLLLPLIGAFLAIRAGIACGLRAISQPRRGRTPVLDHSK